jgi:hypothetical protein
MKVACIIATDQLDRAVRAVHREFFGESEPVEAVGSRQQAAGS